MAEAPKRIHPTQPLGAPKADGASPELHAVDSSAKNNEKGKHKQRTGRRGDDGEQPREIVVMTMKEKRINNDSKVMRQADS